MRGQRLPGRRISELLMPSACPAVAKPEAAGGLGVGAGRAGCPRGLTGSGGSLPVAGWLAPRFPEPRVQWARLPETCTVPRDLGVDAVGTEPPPMCPGCGLRSCPPQRAPSAAPSAPACWAGQSPLSHCVPPAPQAPGRQNPVPQVRTAAGQALGVGGGAHLGVRAVPFAAESLLSTTSPGLGRSPVSITLRRDNVTPESCGTSLERPQAGLGLCWGPDPPGAQCGQAAVPASEGAHIPEATPKYSETDAVVGEQSRAVASCSPRRLPLAADPFLRHPDASPGSRPGHCWGPGPWRRGVLSSQSLSRLCRAVPAPSLPPDALEQTPPWACAPALPTSLSLPSPSPPPPLPFLLLLPPSTSAVHTHTHAHTCARAHTQVHRQRRGPSRQTRQQPVVPVERHLHFLKKQAPPPWVGGELAPHFPGDPLTAAATSGVPTTATAPQWRWAAPAGEACTWGDGSYKAFDGRVFSSRSPCAFTFCRHCVASGGDFAVELQRGNGSAIQRLRATIDGNDVSVSGEAILVNGESVQLPFTNKLIHLRTLGEYKALSSRRGILTLTWDGGSKLSLALHRQYETCGLCGSSGNSSSPGDISELLAASRIPGDCPEAVASAPEVCADGVQHCDRMIQSYFAQCGRVGPLAADYRAVCVDEYCQARGRPSACATFSELSRLCAADGPGAFQAWREDPEVFCEKPSCPKGLVHSECGPANPATCSNVAPFQDSACVSGCTCPQGYLLDDVGDEGACVLKADCPCEAGGKVYRPGSVRDGRCGSHTCQEAKWSCTEDRCPGRCKVEGSSITTFDGVKYSHPGDCHFLAIHDEGWSVTVEFRPCPGGQSGTCLTSVALLLNSSVSVDKYVFNKDGTITNDNIRNQSYYYSDQVQIFKVSSWYLQVETHFHVKMQIQTAPVMQLYLSMPPGRFTDTVGLCGSYNNRAEDDFMSSQNILEKTAQAFADSWEMMSCPKASPASCVSIETETFAERHCGVLLDASGPFAACHPVVNPKPYHEECKKFTCTCERGRDCLCAVLGNYVKACAEQETLLTGWREGRCEHSCPSGLIFKYNVRACNSSCRSLSERDRSCDVEDVPVDGCTCPEGTYQNSEGHCVLQAQCDCYMDDEVLPPGKLVVLDDNTCVCRDGLLLCQTPIDLMLQNCSGGAEYVDCRDPKAQRRVDSTCSTRNIPIFDENLPCKRGCYCPAGMVRDSKGTCVLPDDCPCSFGGQEYGQGSVTAGSWNCTQHECQSTCHVYGEGHVQTFDGRSYSFDGLCQYSFLEDYCGGENGTFRMLTESVPCCEDGLTCSRKIVVAFQDQNVVLHDGKVTAVRTSDSRECALHANAYSVHTVGLYLIVKFKSGMTVIWDKNTRVSVILDPHWHGKVCGLCGNNNGDLKDDFTTRHASVAASALEFGNSWKTSQECADTVAQVFPCDSNPYCKAWAVRKCEIIRDSTFRDCHGKVDPSAYYDACIEEACACDMEGKYQGFCTSVAMYAEACSAVGVCVTWRRPDLCPVYCDYYNSPGECSWHYAPCGTVTAKTCKDHVIGQKFSALLEGCYAKCPDTAPYLDENTMKCVTLSECSCFYNDVIPAGGVVQDDCGRTW
ncbi:Mucin-19 [Galemys pyrenaicus]|uniref:Mucin-19 n=1 Tax=Galemys pyrenaicus TaxID=202257 RepID=A0A8J6AHE8_GALPY|nr:Mucin-19 [Galemys pyrenaicus]